MRKHTARLTRTVAAFISAGLIGVVGISVIPPETVQAAGVVVEHREYGAGRTTPTDG